MIEWKHKFEQNTLERGMTFYTNDRVVDFKAGNDIYSATVLGVQDFKVKIRVDKGFPAYMWCNCPIAEEGGNCEHMAAVLYAAEAKENETEVEYRYIRDMEKYSPNKIEKKEGEEGEETKEETNLLATSLDNFARYRYFDGTAIRKSMDIPESAYQRGESLLRQRQIEILQITSDYASGNSGIGRLSAIGISEQEKFSVNMTFSRNKVQTFECRCPNCRKFYFTRFPQKNDCPYKAGVVIMLEEYLATHNIGDTTDFNAHRLISFYQEKRADMAAAGVIGSKGSLHLIPRLIEKDENLSVSFSVGEKKSYVIRSLDAFFRNVQKSATSVYGNRTKINHSLENFTAKGKEWVHFISRIVREETEFYQRLLESRIYYSYQKDIVGGAINLFGWRLDEFFALLEGESVEYENKDGRHSERRSLTCISRNPKVSMHISEANLGDDEFHGVAVSGNLPDMYAGDDNAYYIDGDYLCRADGDFLKKIEPLSDLAHENAFSFNVGRNYMTEFFNRILPRFQGVVDITETEPEKFRQYLLPDAQFIFYLDTQDRNVTCKLHARYNEKEVSVLDIMDKNLQENYEPIRRDTGMMERENHEPLSNIGMMEHENLEPFRDIKREKEVLSQALQWFPKYDFVEEELHCGSNEDLVYKLIESGTDRLMEIGEVRCTKRFLGYHNIKTVKVSVGVSISSGLLELDISTDDIPQAEMLDILNSYRAKKKYYRLKDGSFVNLNDSSMEMLAELMESMNLKPREFVKGKMNLPMYRALYLDKMLEENSVVYSSRDSRFKEVVKNFKTVSDADFEEPESLAKIMRNYQKNGYKWLRTLESWQFGGILADDMGLGKTLQVIAVLLASIHEGSKRTSLVVCPASLVFNWGEEFRKFAPELKVAYITGTQEERRLKLEAYSESDVVITSYDLLKRDIDFYEDKEFEYEIIDEAQYIKNHTTEAAKAVKIVKSRIRYALTGTPIENRLSELWSIFDFLMPGFLYNYEVFKREMESPIVKNSDEAAMKRLKKMTAPFILRRLKEDVLKDLPQKLEENRFVRLGSTQQSLYDAQVMYMKERLAAQDDAEFNKNKIQVLAQITRLRQICCDPSLCFENYDGGAAKLEACLELIQSAIDGGHRLLVFSQFTSMLEILQSELEKAGIAYYTITGSTSKEKRIQLVNDFNEGDTPVFLISLKAGGVGLNLTGADMVIHYAPWWNLAVQNQATDRAHRIGQTKKVIVYKLIVKNSIEEKILKLQESKKQLAEQVIGGELGQLGSLSREEILELLEV